MGKAGSSALIAWLFDIPVITAASSGYFSKGLQYLFSYRGILLGFVNGLIDSLFGRKIGER